jgi:hypothetical protein
LDCRAMSAVCCPDAASTRRHRRCTSNDRAGSCATQGLIMIRRENTGQGRDGLTSGLVVVTPVVGLGSLPLGTVYVLRGANRSESIGIASSQRECHLHQRK